eukprot:1490830-Pleurochrysis_carterae.AAC.1
MIPCTSMVFVSLASWRYKEVRMIRNDTMYEYGCWSYQASPKEKAIQVRSTSHQNRARACSPARDSHPPIASYRSQVSTRASGASDATKEERVRELSSRWAWVPVLASEQVH